MKSLHQHFQMYLQKGIQIHEYFYYNSTSPVEIFIIEQICLKHCWDAYSLLKYYRCKFLFTSSISFYPAFLNIHNECITGRLLSKRLFLFFPFLQQGQSRNSVYIGIRTPRNKMHAQKFSHVSEKVNFGSSVREALSTEQYQGQSKNNYYVGTIRLAVYYYLGISLSAKFLLTLCGKWQEEIFWLRYQWRHTFLTVKGK